MPARADPHDDRSVELVDEQLAPRPFTRDVVARRGPAPRAIDQVTLHRVREPEVREQRDRSRRDRRGGAVDRGAQDARVHRRVLWIELAQRGVEHLLRRAATVRSSRERGRHDRDADADRAHAAAIRQLARRRQGSFCEHEIRLARARDVGRREHQMRSCGVVRTRDRGRVRPRAASLRERSGHALRARDRHVEVAAHELHRRVLDVERRACAIEPRDLPPRLRDVLQRGRDVTFDRVRVGVRAVRVRARARARLRAPEHVVGEAVREHGLHRLGGEQRTLGERAPHEAPKPRRARELDRPLRELPAPSLAGGAHFARATGVRILPIAHHARGKLTSSCPRPSRPRPAPPPSPARPSRPSRLASARLASSSASDSCHPRGTPFGLIGTPKGDRTSNRRVRAFAQNGERIDALGDGGPTE